MLSSAPANFGYNNNVGLDLVRAVCALLVLFAHTEALWNSAFGVPRSYFMRPAGFFAVEGFFVLSGVLIGPLLFRAFDSGLVQNIGVFLVRRWMRTLPLYWLALGAYALLDRASAGGQSLCYPVFCQNLISAMPPFFSVSWSLSVEEWFYILAPLLLILISRARVGSAIDRYRLVLLAIIVVSFCCRLVFLRDIENWDSEIRKVVVLRLDALAVGALLVSYRWNVRKELVLDALVILVCCWALLSLRWAALNDNSLPSFAALSALFATTPFAVFFLIAGVASLSIPRSSTVVFFAAISYPLYLFHIPVLILFQFNQPNLGVGAIILYYLCATLAAAAAHFLVEKPIMAARPGFADAVQKSG